MIPEPYLREAHTRIVRDIVAGSPAGDSTGYSGNRFTRWFSIRHGRTKTKRGWIKLHSIIDISTRAILDCHITDGYAADITGMWPMIDRLGASGKDGSFFCLDSAYLARLLCDAIANLGWIPRILPKSNTVCRNGGSQAWGDMTRMHRDDLERFMSEYHRRSIIEAVFGAIKKMYGNRLRGRKFVRQKREVAIRVICYNIEVVARSHVKNGRLTHESLAALAA
jgi:transposase